MLLLTRTKIVITKGRGQLLAAPPVWQSGNPADPQSQINDPALLLPPPASDLKTTDATGCTGCETTAESCLLWGAVYVLTDHCRKLPLQQNCE